RIDWKRHKHKSVCEFRKLRKSGSVQPHKRTCRATAIELADRHSPPVLCGSYTLSKVCDRAADSSIGTPITRPNGTVSLHSLDQRSPRSRNEPMVEAVCACSQKRKSKGKTRMKALHATGRSTATPLKRSPDIITSHNPNKCGQKDSQSRSHATTIRSDDVLNSLVEDGTQAISAKEITPYQSTLQGRSTLARTAVDTSVAKPTSGKPKVRCNTPVTYPVTSNTMVIPTIRRSKANYKTGTTGCSRHKRLSANNQINTHTLRQSPDGRTRCRGNGTKPHTSRVDWGENTLVHPMSDTPHTSARLVSEPLSADTLGRAQSNLLMNANASTNKKMKRTAHEPNAVEKPTISLALGGRAGFEPKKVSLHTKARDVQMGVPQMISINAAVNADNVALEASVDDAQISTCPSNTKREWTDVKLEWNDPTKGPPPLLLRTVSDNPPSHHLLDEQSPNTLMCAWHGCDAREPDGDALFRHMYMHVTELPVACAFENCGMDFSSHANLVAHTSCHFIAATHTCAWKGCDFAFSRKRREHFVTHMRTHTREAAFACPWENCDAVATAKQVIVKHMMKHHSGVLPFACTEGGCDKRYATKYALARHRVTHTDRFACVWEGCEKRLSCEAKLNAHMMSHAGKKLLS
ncbi:hypothetical protein SARC_12353, partial [Sphaeroforma arctica JP610]